MNNEISHVGTVDSIENSIVHVKILQSSACSSCKVSSYCSSAESKEKIIDVRCLNANDYTVGQTVQVMAANSVGMKAVVLAFVVPSILLIAVVAGLLAGGYSEVVAALSGIACLAPYYMVLYLFRGKLEKILTFYLKA